MKITFHVCATLVAVYFASAYDNFQGLGRLAVPCFPHFDHSEECSTNLVEAYDPPVKAASSNPPTTQFFLFTPTHPNKAEQLFQCGGGLPPSSTFDDTIPTEVLIHGGTDGTCRTAWQREMINQYHLKGKYNVILVDWTWGNTPDFATAAINTKVAGYQVAYVLKKIAEQTGYDCSLFHIVANSYGVSVASQAGKAMQEETCRLGRLTALDDAFPSFLYAPEEDRLNRRDALFVDVLHTNAGDCFPFSLGDPRNMGHVNFYINDGTHQYSCYPYAMTSLLKLDFYYALGTLIYPALCSHVQSIQYYKVSILAEEDNSQMIGVQCESYDEWMDGACERNCEKEGNCLPLGLDLPKYINTSNLNNEEPLIFYVPGTLICPYADHSGFTGLPLKPIMSTPSQK